MDPVPLLHAGVAVVIYAGSSVSVQGARSRRNSPKLRFGSQSHFPRAHEPSPRGQWMYGLCSYPISSKKWIWSLFANRDTAMLCTGASPQRYDDVSMNNARAGEKPAPVTHLVVEAAGTVEVLEEFCVRLVAPEVHARDLEVAPDCARAPSVSIFRNANAGYVQ